MEPGQYIVPAGPRSAASMQLSPRHTLLPQNRRSSFRSVLRIPDHLLIGRLAPMSPALGVDMLAHPAIHKGSLGMLPPWTAQEYRGCSRLSAQITLIEHVAVGLPFGSGGCRDVACMASAIPQAVQRAMLEAGRCSPKNIIYRSLNITVLV